MRKLLPLLAATLLFVSLAGAQDDKPTHPTKASIRYHAYRQQNVEPLFGLAKVKALVRKVKDDSEGNRRLPESAYNGLSKEEKFTYTMIHGEDFTQNCDVMPAIEEEDKKIFPYPLSPFGDEAIWSQRQRDFMHQNRGTVVSLIRSTIRAHHRVGANLKAAVLEIDGYELIPDLVSEFNRDQKDNDILSVLMRLMEDGKYAPFLASQSHEKLYGANANWRAFLVGNSANKKLITDRAMAYYKTRKP